MKNILGHWAWRAFLAAPVIIARADNTAPSHAPAPPAAMTLPAAPTPLHSSSVMLPAPQAPADGVEFSTEDPEAIAERTMEIQAEQRRNAASNTPSLEADQGIADSDWMLRDYTARLKQQGLAQTADTDPTTFAPSLTSSASPTTTSADASVDPLLNPPAPAKTPTQPAVNNQADQAKPEISIDDLTSSESPASLQPLLPPLDAAPLKTPSRDPWGSTTVAAADVDIVLPPSSSSETSNTTSSLDVPGLTAAQSGMGSPVLDDVSLQDPLPGESDQQRKLDNQNNFLAPTAPTSDVAEFFKKQNEGLQAPTAPNVPQAPNAPTIVVQAPQPAEPIAKPAVSGLRSHVDDPFDILRQ